MPTPPTTFAEYLAIQAWNWSRIKLINDSPAHLKHALDHPDDGDTTSRGALRANHCAVLQPELFPRLHPVYSGRRDKRSGDYQTFLGAHATADSILNPGEADIAHAIAAAVRAHPIAGPLLCGPGGQSELNTVYTDEITGLACKGRQDRRVTLDRGPWLLPEHQGDGSITIADLKTWRSTKHHLVFREIVKALWHGQLAHYGAGDAAAEPSRPIHYRLVVVEQVKARGASGYFDVGVYDLDGEPIEAGQRLRRACLDTLAECLESGDWPGRCPNLVPVNLPDWATGDEMEDIDTEDETEMP